MFNFILNIMNFQIDIREHFHQKKCIQLFIFWNLIVLHSKNKCVTSTREIR